MTRDPAEDKKRCPPGMRRDPKTKECVGQKVKRCPPGHFRDPKSGECLPISEMPQKTLVRANHMPSVYKPGDHVLGSVIEMPASKGKKALTKSKSKSKSKSSKQKAKSKSRSKSTKSKTKSKSKSKSVKARREIETQTDAVPKSKSSTRRKSSPLAPAEEEKESEPHQQEEERRELLAMFTLLANRFDNKKLRDHYLRQLVSKWRLGGLTPRVFNSKVASIQEVNNSYRRFVDSIEQDGILRTFNSRPRPVVTPEDWADAVETLYGFQNYYEQALYTRPMTDRDLEELEMYCNLHKKETGQCDAPCGVRNRMIGKAKCSVSGVSPVDIKGIDKVYVPLDPAAQQFA